MSTLMPYKDIDDAVALTKLGKSLCTGIATYDDSIAQQFVWGAASHHGRMLVIDRDMAKENTGHESSPLATLATAVLVARVAARRWAASAACCTATPPSSSPTTITALTQQYQQVPSKRLHRSTPSALHFGAGGRYRDGEKHTVTLDDINNFADLVRDKFYAHMDENAWTAPSSPDVWRTALHPQPRMLFVDAPKGRCC
ncbi:MAG: hypothetical protein R2818_08195 [Flavobacteriales bacterium]